MGVPEMEEFWDGLLQKRKYTFENWNWLIQ